MRTQIITIAVVFLSSAAVTQTAPLPPAPARHIVTISPANSRGNEPSISVNPNNPNQIVAAFQPATIAYSTDGAQSFGTADLPPVEGWRGGGDVSVTFDDKGHAYLGSLHFDKLGSTSYWAHGAGRNGIFVRRSLDGGKTWEKDATTVKAYQGNEPDIQWEDMPRLFADVQPKSSFRGNVYAGWIEWQ